MNFPKEFFQHTAFEKPQIEQFFKKAKKNLEIAKDSKHNEVVLHFCYNSIIQLGISMIAEKGYKIRGIPGYHVKLLETMANLLDCRDEIDYLQKIRHKRNIDMYEGGSALTDKQSVDLLHMTESLFKKYNARNKKTGNTSGFTLVELMVSVGITALLMMGLATFFSSTFGNMFATREQAVVVQSEFAVNTILNGKFAKTAGLQGLGTAPSDYAVLRNSMDTDDLPFTFIGKKEIDGTNRIVFKDFFVFNGKEGTLNSQSASDIKNPAGLTLLNGKVYIASPTENDIYICTNPAGPNGCSPLDLTGLNQPTDITNDGNVLYVTDAGNDRVLKIMNPEGPGRSVEEVILPNAGFDHPTGLAHYASNGNSYLFVADTYNHVVKKITLPNGPAEVMVGGGNDTGCDPSDGRDHTA